jgi:HAD superfamily hydrolase (TIGR01450 family)
VRPKAIVFDITGTLRYANNEPIPGAPEAIAAIRQAGYAVCCLSNNPREAPARVVATLAEAGFTFHESEVLTANAVTAEYLARHYAGKHVFVLESGSALSEQIAQRGVLLDESAQPDAVVVAFGVIGRDPPRAEQLVHAAELVRRGAALLATNVDMTAPAGLLRFVPVSGSFVRVIEELSGHKATVVGKPSAWAAQLLLESLGVAGADVVMVGDQMDSDVGFGQSMGARTVLVLTGAALPWEEPLLARVPNPPTVILASVAQLPAWLERLEP